MPFDIKPFSSESCSSICEAESVEVKSGSKMGKQSRSKKTQQVGKGKVTPVQIAFLVDRYLSDNGYMHSRSSFRSEASDVISNSPVHEAPKGMLSLAAILDDYITLKEQKLWVDQERCRLEQEKLRVQNLLVGMQGAMDAYNTSGNDAVKPPVNVPPPAIASGSAVSRSDPTVLTPAGYATYRSPALPSTSITSHIQKDPSNFSTPVMYQATTKRKQMKYAGDGPMTQKKSRRCTQSKDVNTIPKSISSENGKEKPEINSTVQSSTGDNAQKGSSVQGSNVVKCLFNEETPSPPANSAVPKTPQRLSSLQTENSSSPDISPQILSANCTIISSEMVRVSPTKQIAYYSIEKNHISSHSPHSKTSSMKDHVKGKLEFDTSNAIENRTCDGKPMSESDKQGNILDLDFPCFDAFGSDFNFSDLLLDFDIGNEELGVSSGLDSSPELHSGSPQPSANDDTRATAFPSQFPSSLAGFLEQEDIALMGSDTISASRSITQCITIVSPVKRR